MSDTGETEPEQEQEDEVTQLADLLERLKRL
jgi:hypothetical protein